MKTTFLILVLLLNIGGGLDKSSQRNHLRNQAQEALAEEDYSKAALYYQKLVDDFQVNDPQTRLNLANAYFKADDLEKARSEYAMISQNAPTDIKARAHHQLGAIAFQQQELEEALQAFKSALKANPYHEKAAYNYELVKKMLEQQEDQEDDQDQDKDDQDDEEEQDEDKDDEGDSDENGDSEDEEGEDSDEGESDEEEQDGDGDEQQDGEEQEDQSEQDDEREQQMQDRKQRFEEGDMTEEKAEMLLESMKNQEIQYMQQRKRTTEEDNYSGRPDW